MPCSTAHPCPSPASTAAPPSSSAAPPACRTTPGGRCGSTRWRVDGRAKLYRRTVIESLTVPAGHVMKTLTIQLPDDTAEAADEAARRLGLSVEALVRTSVEE